MSAINDVLKEYVDKYNTAQEVREAMVRHHSSSEALQNILNTIEQYAAIIHLCNMTKRKAAFYGKEK